MTENQKASEIAVNLTQSFRENFNHYMSMRANHPYETMLRFRQFMFKLGLLTEIWVTIDKRLKEKYHVGQGRTTDVNQDRGSIGDSERGI